MSAFLFIFVGIPVGLVVAAAMCGVWHRFRDSRAKLLGLDWGPPEKREVAA